MDVVTIVGEKVIGQQRCQPLSVDANPDPNTIQVWVSDEAAMMVDFTMTLSQFTGLGEVRGHLDANVFHGGIRYDERR